MNRLLFSVYLIILFWLPLPAGSVPVWARLLFCTLVFLISTLYAFRFFVGKIHQVPRTFIKAWPFHIAFLVVCVWVWLQQVPLPPGFLRALSPVSFDYHSTAQNLLSGSSPFTISLDPHSTALQALLTTAYYCLFMLTLLLVDSGQRLKMLLSVLVAIGVVQAVFGVVSTLSGQEALLFGSKKYYHGVATGTYVNRNSFAGLLELTLAAGIGMLISQLNNYPYNNWRERLYASLKALLSHKVLVRSALAIMVIGLVVSRSRMGNIAFFSSLIITVMIYVTCRKKLSRGVLFLFVSLIIIDVAIVSQWFGLERVVERLSSTSLDVETRPEVSELTLRMITDFPFTGTGVGSYYTSLPAYHNGTWKGFYDLAHNDLLQFPAEFGLPISLILAAMVVSAVVIAIRAMRVRRRRIMQGAGFSAVMGLSALMIHSSVDFNLQIPANAAFFVVFIAIALLSKHLELGNRIYD